MSDSNPFTFLRRRRDGIREWLDDEALMAADQRHLDADTPERPLAPRLPGGAERRARPVQ
jgi:hypothetical protein